MRILHLIPFAFRGGTEKDCYYTIRGLEKASHDVVVFDKAGPMTHDWENVGARVKHLDVLLRPLQLFRKLKRFSKENDYHGIFYWSTIHLPLVVSAVNIQSCNVAIHVGNPVDNGFKTRFKNWALGKLLATNPNLRLFPCSKYVAETLKLDPYLRRLPYTVSHNPVSVPKKNKYKAKKLLKRSTINLGMVARLDAIKDQNTIISAFKMVWEQYPKSKLHFFGEGKMRKELEQKVNELELTDAVFFHGNVKDVYASLRELDLFVYSTTAKEGLGNAVTEALANGLPCVISDLPMLRELAGANSVLYANAGNAGDFSKKIIQLIKDQKLREELSGIAYSRASNHFTADRYIKDRMNFIDSK